jgi:hypothetical protein
MALMPYAAAAAVLQRDLAWDVVMYPSGLSPDEATEGASLGPLFFPRFTAMVSAGRAGAHVQPVLEKTATSL